MKQKNISTVLALTFLAIQGVPTPSIAANEGPVQLLMKVVKFLRSECEAVQKVSDASKKENFDEMLERGTLFQDPMPKSSVDALGQNALGVSSDRERPFQLLRAFVSQGDQATYSEYSAKIISRLATISHSEDFVYSLIPQKQLKTPDGRSLMKLADRLKYEFAMTRQLAGAKGEHVSAAYAWYFHKRSPEAFSPAVLDGVLYNLAESGELVAARLVINTIATRTLAGQPNPIPQEVAAELFASYNRGDFLGDSPIARKVRSLGAEGILEMVRNPALDSKARLKLLTDLRRGNVNSPTYGQYDNISADALVKAYEFVDRNVPNQVELQTLLLEIASTNRNFTFDQTVELIESATFGKMASGRAQEDLQKALNHFVRESLGQLVPQAGGQVDVHRLPHSSDSIQALHDLKTGTTSMQAADMAKIATGAVIDVLSALNERGLLKSEVREHALRSFGSDPRFKTQIDRLVASSSAHPAGKLLGENLRDPSAGVERRDEHESREAEAARRGGKPKAADEGKAAGDEKK